MQDVGGPWQSALLHDGALQRHLSDALDMVLWSSNGNICAPRGTDGALGEKLEKRRTNTYQVNIIQKAPEVSQLEEMCALSAVPRGGVLSSWGDGPQLMITQPTDAGVGGLTGQRPTWKVTACRSISA